MATMTLSTALMARITDKVTYRNTNDTVWEMPYLQQNLSTNSYVVFLRDAANSFVPPLVGTSVFGGYTSNTSQVLLESAVATFYDAGNTALVQYTNSNPGFNQVTRTIDASGYCVLANFPQVTPLANGTIDYLKITNPGTSITQEMTFSVGALGSGADIEIVDRNIVTTQPWRLDGVLKFRVPGSYTWTT